MDILKNFPKNGTVAMADGNNVAYTIMAASDLLDLTAEEAAQAAFNQLKYGDSFAYQDYTIATWGDYNLLPNETIFLIQNNPELPEMLKKLVRILYGNGPYLYQEQEQDNKVIRVPVTSKYPEVMNWLDSWEKVKGLEPFHKYAKKVMFDYFYVEGAATNPWFNRSRRINGNMPIAGLKHIPIERCRLALPGKLSPNEFLEDDMLTKVLVNRWEHPNRFSAKEFDRFDPSDPFRSNTVINLMRDQASGEDIYPIGTSHFGLREWIKGANLAPKYANSYFKHALGSSIHVIIPGEWIRQKVDDLKRVISENQSLEQDGKDIIPTWEGITIGTIFDFALIKQLIDKKIYDATEAMSGEGKNQGKAFWSQSYMTEHGIEKWQFEEIPVKYAEYINTITSYNSSALKMIMAGKGVDPAISNVSNEGVFNSGSQVYYSYIVFLAMQGYPEEFVTEDLNRFARLNFPKLVADRVKIGFIRPNIDRLANTSPSNRLDQQIQ